MNDPQANPYVGPKPFTAEEWALFFGRRHEAAALLSLVLRNRLVLFCAPSGAGKTSLLNTTLRRELHDQGFEVLPIARVSGDAPAGAPEVTNIFTFNLISSLDRGQHPATTLTQTTLAELLRQLRPPALDNQPESRIPYVLIIDQFEEIFTSHPECWQQRGPFFEQLSEAMARDKLLWVVLAMREEYIARLDRYAPLVPGQLSTRFYMQGLEHDSALEAIEKPAKIGGRPFKSGVAQELVNNLCLMKVRNHEVTIRPGEFIEPVQLQVVCQQLWEAIKVEPHEMIRMADVERVAGEKGLIHFIDSALGRFYEAVVDKTVKKSGIPELDLRCWIEEKLITPTGTRNLLQRGIYKTEGMVNPVIDQLEKQLLIHHADVRSEGDWYELIHDGLITPIRLSNLAWYQQQQPLIQMAREWEQSGREDNRLLEGQRLETVLERPDWLTLGTLVTEFLDASRALQNNKEKERERRESERRHKLALAQEAEKRHRLEAEAARKLADEAEARRRVEAAAKQRLQRLTIGLAVALVLVLVAAGTAANYWQAAQTSLNLYKTETQKRFTETLAREAEQMVPTDDESIEPQLSLLLAVEAVAHMPEEDSTALNPDPLEVFYQILKQTQGIPLRDQNGEVVADIAHLAVSDDGQWAAAGTTNGRVLVWNLTDAPAERAAASFSAHHGPTTAIAFSPGQPWLATGGQDGVVNVFDLTTLYMTSIPAEQEHGEILALAFHPTEHWLAVGRDRDTVRRLDLPPSDRPRLTELLDDNTLGTATLAFSPDGRWLVTVSTADTLRLWSLTAPLPIKESRLLSEGKNGLVAFSPNSDWLAGGKEDEPTVQLFNVDDSEALPTKLAGLEQGVTTLSFSQDGEFLVIGESGGVARWWPMTDVVGDISVQSAAQNVRPTPTPALKLDTKAPQAPPAIQSIINPKPVEAHVGPIQALAFETQSPHVSLLATAGADHVIRLWLNNDLTAPQAELYGHDAEVTAVFFGSSPRLLVTASKDGAVRFWDLDRPQAPRNLTELQHELEEKWIPAACRRAGRDFTPGERVLHLGDPAAPSTCAKYLIPPGS